MALTNYSGIFCEKIAIILLSAYDKHPLKIAKSRNKCVIVVTHSKEVAKAADYILEIKNKNLKEVNFKKNS